MGLRPRYRGVWALVFWFVLVSDVRADRSVSAESQPVTSLRLPQSPLSNPFPSGVIAGYAGDTGLDIAGKFLPVYAVRSGFIDYAERGHTVWTKAPDTPLSVRIEFDEPLVWRGKRITHAYYTHMSKLAMTQPEHATLRRHVEAGEFLGISGIGNGTPHLHLGLLLDGHVEQDHWKTLLLPGEIAALLGYRNGSKLPPLPLLPSGTLTR